MCKRAEPGELGLVNCNFVVDEILEMAPPYALDKNKKKVESQSSSLQSSFFDQTLPCTGVAIQDIEGIE